MWISLFFIKADFILPQAEQFDKSINLFCSVFLTFKFSLAVYFLQLTHSFLIITYNRTIFFLTLGFIVFVFFILSDLNSDPNNLVEMLFIRVFFSRLFNMSKYFMDSFQISKSSLLESILINLQPNSFSIDFYHFIS